MTRMKLKLSVFTVAVLILVITLMIVLPLAEAPDESVAGNFIIKNVDIVDVKAGKILAGQDVTIRAGRVSQIEEASEAASPPSFNIIDGRGKYTMPGLGIAHRRLSLARSVEAQSYS